MNFLSLSRSVTLGVGFTLVLFTGMITLTSCDDSPSSVEDFEIQPTVEVSTQQVGFIAGQTPDPTLELVYQGLDEHPSAETGLPDLVAEKVEENGTPEDGNQTWSLKYTSTFEENSLNDTLSVTAPGGGRTIEKRLPVRVDNPVSVVSDFESSFALVTDYETGYTGGTENGAGILYGWEASGSSVADTTEESAVSSNGETSLEIDATAGDPITFTREISTPGSNVFRFLIKPDANTDFTLTLGFTEETGSGLQTREIDVSVPSGSQWQQYNVAVGEIFSDFNPVAVRSGGNGPLKEISMTTDADVSFSVDQLMMGTPQSTLQEVNDFQATSNAYGDFSNIEFGETTDLGPSNTGTVARTMSWASGGSFFGYNFDGLRPSLEGSDVLSLEIGQVDRGFFLYVFVQTPQDAEGNRIGGFSFAEGDSLEIAADQSWRNRSIQISELGEDPSALKDPGITNVGFEIRRLDSDDSSEPINFAIDDIVLRPGD
jgi:hypothetical protein